MRLNAAIISAAVLLVTAGGPAAAQETKKVVGNWLVTLEPDRFGDGARVFAMTSQNEKVLAVRCMRRNLSIALVELRLLGTGRFEEGMKFTVKFRADRNPIIETVGFGLSDLAFQLDTPREMVRQIMAAKEVAFRVTYRDTTADWIFRAGAASKALVDVIKECPRNAAADRE
jgi:hypothetical protein